MASDSCDAVRDDDRGKLFAAIESTFVNTLNAVWNGGALATANKGVCVRLDNCMTILSAIIHGIAFCYYNRSKAFATRKSAFANTRNAIRDSDAG